MSQKNEKKKKNKIGKIIFWSLFIIFLGCLLYKPIVEHIVIPHSQDRIEKETKGTSGETYSKNANKINDELNLSGWTDKADERFEYNNKPENNTITGMNGINNTNQDYSPYGNENSPDLTYDYENVRSVSEYDLSTLNPDYDERLLIGHISIPSISTNLPILEGVSNSNLYAGAGTLKPYQKMGKDNYALASHFMPDETSNFSRLKELNKGNRIYLTDGKKVYEYKTTGVKEMPINSSSVVNDVKGKNEVTLVTCTDIYGTKRLVVKGDFVKSYSMDSDKGKYSK